MLVCFIKTQKSLKRGLICAVDVVPPFSMCVTVVHRRVTDEDSLVFLSFIVSEKKRIKAFFLRVISNA